jgi:lysyl oxidase
MAARRAGWAAGALAATALIACGGGGGAPAPELLPDLDQAPPSAISVVRRKGRERLVFLSAVENVGAGPLVVSGRRASRAQTEMTARQVVRRDDGSRVSYRLRARFRFVVSETHRHWHLLGFEQYELLTADGKRVGRDRKTGFCLGDRYDAHASIRLAGEPVRAVWTQECGRGQPRRLRILEGLSPGFGDDYVPLLEGQYVDVTGLPADRYLLVHRVNSKQDLRESDYSNDAASALLELHRPADGPAAVTVVASCPGTPRCG